MIGNILSFALPLLVTILFMLALRPVARGVGLIDRPGGRKMHVGEIPVIGGLAMTGGLLVGALYAHQVVSGFPFFIAAIGVLVIIGALDDRYDLPPAVRFLAQICATLLMVAGADVFTRDIGTVFFGGVVELGWFAVPFTLLIVLTAINAFNMFDGSDGIAGAQGIIAIVFLGFACLTTGAVAHLPVLASLAGSLLGFLLFNWPSQRTHSVRAFMGDAGSTTLGFTLAWISIELSQPPIRAIPPVVILWIFALPIYDLFSSMIRRVTHGQSPFHGDSEHLHHVLKRLGYSSRRVAQLVLVGAALFAAVGVGGYMNGLADGWLFVLWLVLGGLYHVVFGTSLVIKREERENREELLPGKYGSAWKHR
jgi:UDP-GlcNAc:undecaprenyl-phosphate GlcNAc-1-phosphate transferase